MIQAILQRIARNTDVALAVGVIGLIGVMIVPLPPPFLDVLLVLNISFALIVILMTMYVLAPLELSVFPGMLLVLTLYRLSLNVASTRLILSEAYAGEVIKAFGTFVVKGDYVLGFIIFIILIIIQFVVITRGAARIAEVAARFTLDAMPGKQMSIDADLNAGLISEDEARKRRENISREADFYGAMDGASKFVRGDAIASMLITLINIIGGLAIGTLQRGMTLGGALRTYTLLTVGDGLVTQIPALIGSTAAGILITRAASESNLGQDLVRQMTARPKAMMIAAGMLVVFGLVPGLPTLPFLLLASLAGGVSYVAVRSQREMAERERAEQERAERKPEERIEDYLRVDILETEIGYGLIPLVDPSQGGDLLDRVTMIRKQTALDLGILVPPVRIRDNIQLKPDDYEIKIKGVEVAGGTLNLKHYLAMNPGYVEEEIEGIDTTEPAFGLPAKWIPESSREKAELLGYTVVEPTAVLATHLTEVIKAHAHEILGRQDVQHLLDQLKESYPAVIEELVPQIITLGGIHKILQNLLRERVPIRDLLTILEMVADYASTTTDPDILTEYVRAALGRTISHLYQDEEGKIAVLAVDPRLERELAESIQSTPTGITVAFPPDRTGRLFEKTTELIDTMISNAQQPIVLTSPNVRLAFRRLTESTFPSLIVLSYNEIVPGVEVFSVGLIVLEDEN